MKFLKGLALGLSACLLFASLLMLSLAFAANATFLSAGFVQTEIQKLDTSAVARDLLPESLPGNLGPYSSSIDATIVELKPWLDSQADLAVRNVYDYLGGQTAALDFTVSAEIARQTLLKNFDAAYKKSPPPQYLQLSTSQQSQMLGQAEQQVKDLFPQDLKLKINEKTLGTDTSQALNRVKTAYGYARNAYLALIAAAIVLVLLIALILRQTKGIARALGIVFILAGGLAYGVSRLSGSLLSNALIGQDWPAQVQSWFPALVRDILSPLGMFSLGLLIAGLVLLAASLVFRSDH